MYEYIAGILAELTPSYAVVENAGGIGWLVNISLNTYSAIEHQEKVKLYVHHVVREDAQLLFGFADKQEREIFRLLIEVSGIGPNTARVILSSMSPSELQSAIINEDAKLISRVKGIGAKTAQRVVIDLKDKIGKALGDSAIALQNVKSISPHRDEAVAALVMLGYQKLQAEKAVELALSKEPSMSAEDLIKFALRNVK
ncbi:MAG: Holliday junction branch migration protein RuvA [Bacteroidales bacterium]|nr:Holliday junction branch migration protein RuvA [Bacteroidales bacterium]